jgi:hypothetical protein
MRTLPLLAAASCVSIGIIAMSGCGTQPAGQLASARSAPPGPHQRAVADAARIIASFPVPPGAVRSGRAPVPVLGAPPQWPATPDLVTVTRWWTAPGKPRAVLAWVAAHVPAGFTLTGQGSEGRGSAGDAWLDMFDLPAVPDVLTKRSLLVEVTSDGARTAVRADAQVSWLPPRPASERIPPGATVVTLALVPGFGPGPGRKLSAEPPVTITDPVKVAGIAAVVDRLSLYPPGEFSCPEDSGSGIRLTFRASRNGPVLALVTGEDTGCQGVSVVVDGKSQPRLAGAASLRRDVLAIAGIRWPATR